ncbi:AraC family transcriptional regulator [Ktedonobacter sp. SOSP1-85]|uniref:AraC family transcriptional regulator n=1 Tax=Ktedonobacter sp. SOSP1-85 TaxID=2778367 RepID=UPI001915EC41|nr:AraC family transcriptional regulator [Ktedonobacter sp. SOSP1-85]GHO76650.1 AraC family transcriptional regulator [Ktedonobacter sp. SOSP1-85]
MDYRMCIQRSIDYIEEHLRACITVDELARIAGFSTYHYYRVFNAYVGVPVVEYIRRRRLAYAAAELIRGKRILDIAMEYGFDTYNGFAKAFRKTYGCSPEQYRSHVSGQLPQKVNLLLFQEYNIAGGIVVEPKIISKPAAKVAGYELKTTCLEGKNLQEIPAFWSAMTPEKFATLHKTFPVVHHNELGICYPPDSVTGEFSYVIAVEVENYDGVPADMFRGEVPEANYAVFTVPPVENIGPEFSDAIQGTWKYIMTTWFPESGYEFAEGKADYELYYDATKVEIYIPIKKKA